MCKVPNCRRLLSTLRCRYSWNQGNEKYFCLMISTYYLQWHFVIWISSKVDFSSLSGRAVLVVNVASQCGYTDSHYRGLKRLHDVLGYSNKLAVLGQWSVFKLRKYYNISPQPSRVTSSAGRSRAQLRTSARWPSSGTGRGSPWWRRWRWRGPASTPSGGSSQASEVFVYYIYCLDTSVILNLKHIKELLL